LLKNPECKNYIQYSKRFQGRLCFQSKRKFLKNPYFNAVKNFQGKLCFSGQAQVVQNSEGYKYIQHSEFRAHSVFQGKQQLLKHPECKSILLNTVKNFMTNSVFRASPSSSKILKDKNISVQ